MDYQKERQRIRKMERVLHFCGYSFFDEVSSAERFSLADQYFSWISKNPEVLEAFLAYQPTNVVLPQTFESRISGLAVVIANYIQGNHLFSRNLVEKKPEFQKSQLFKHDPYFGEYVDSLIGKAEPPEVVLKSDFKGKSTIKIADFGCAPKRDGGSNIRFLKAVLPGLFPNNQFEFFGYDIDFRRRYPTFSEEGNFNGWEEGYVFNEEGVAYLDDVTYYNAAQNSQFDLVPQKRSSKFVNTFNALYNKYDVIINSMFYSVLEMNGEPEESLNAIRNNLFSLRTLQGVVFLNTCDDCFKIFPASNKDALSVVVPFVPTIINIDQKISEILTGGKYCNGVYSFDYEPSPEERKRVEISLYYAHRLARKELTFLDRLFEVYERINGGSNLEQALVCLTDSDLAINPERRKQTRDRIYTIKRQVNGN